MGLHLLIYPLKRVNNIGIIVGVIPFNHLIWRHFYMW